MMTEWIHMAKQSGMELVGNCPLAPHSSFRIGGNARLAVFPTTCEQLLSSLQLAAKSDAPYVVVGNGSNLLFPDEDYCGTVIFTAKYREIQQNNAEITASAGASLPTLSKRARDASLTGLEFASGIPGTVGGAVFMNAGAFGGDMSQITSWSEYWDPDIGACCRLEGELHAFGKRTSIYAKNPQLTLLRAGFVLKEGKISEIDARMADYRSRRSSTQPLEFPNAGSIFKHPVGHYAGKLIEDCGLKGLRVGGAEVSVKHAGFIVNKGNATSEDVKRLIEEIRSRVLQVCGISLECELRILENPK